MGRDRPTPSPGSNPPPGPPTEAEAVVKLGSYEVACKRIRAEVWHLDGTHRLARYRCEWPDFWEAVDDMIALLDKDYPPYPLPTTTLFD
jgi:hypothetical protein